MVRHIKHVKWSATAGIAVVLAAAGYGVTTGPSTPAQAVGSPQVVGEGNLALPLDAYHLSALQTGEQVNESNILQRSCMKSYGIGYLVNVPNVTAKVAAGFAVDDSRRYGISDPSAAKTYGYHLPTLAAPAAAPLHQSESLSGPQYTVLAGVTGKAGQQAPATVARYDGKAIPQGGCMGVATGILHAPDTSTTDQNATQLAANLQQEDFLTTQASPRVHVVFGQWSTCMAAHGYHYANPIAAATDPRWNLTKPATRPEVRTAVTDVTCKQKTNLVGVEYAVETALQKTSIEQHARALAPLRTLTAVQAKALRNAMTTYRN
jgi:hypothetical protein